MDKYRKILGIIMTTIGCVVVSVNLFRAESCFLLSIGIPVYGLALQFIGMLYLKN